MKKRSRRGHPGRRQHAPPRTSLSRRLWQSRRAERLEPRWLLANDFWQLPGNANDLVDLQFDFFAQESSFDNSFGVYIVDDLNGTVDGLAPGAPGYAAAVFDNGTFQTVFDSDDGPGSHQQIAIGGNQTLAFFLIANGTVDDFVGSNPTNVPGNSPVAFFSFDTANPDNMDHVWSQPLPKVIPIDGTVLRWEDLVGIGDGDFDDVIISTYQIGIRRGANGPVNDAPSFNLADGPPASLEDGGSMSIASFATNISPGPADEAGQSLDFLVTNNTNPDLFSSAPAIAADGTLSYTAAPDASGTANVTVVLMDDGGTGNGGDDTSDPQQFTITVNPVNDEPTFNLADDPPRPTKTPRR